MNKLNAKLDIVQTFQWLKIHDKLEIALRRKNMPWAEIYLHRLWSKKRSIKEVCGEILEDYAQNPRAVLFMVGEEIITDIIKLILE